MCNDGRGCVAARQAPAAWPRRKAVKGRDVDRVLMCVDALPRARGWHSKVNPSSGILLYQAALRVPTPAARKFGCASEPMRFGSGGSLAKLP